MARVRIDHGAVAAFAREHGLSGALTIRRVGQRAGYWGECESYMWGEHVITLTRDHNPTRLAHTLAHELRHAIQCEREPGGFRAFLARCRDESRLACPYGERPLEADADAFADAHADALAARAFREIG